jgi:ATP-dependent helicase HrpB
LQPLPIDDVMPEVLAELRRSSALVIEAPPGAGKTTRVPPALLDLAEIAGDIVVLEPRRLAARMAARRVAEERGERLGETVGYKVRFDEAGGAKTRLWFVTEGILTRRLASDPSLRGVGAVVLDEFHERHLHGDVALALVRRLLRTTRPELRVVVMSATLDAEPVKTYLECKSIASMGRAYDVAIEHLESADDRPLEKQLASSVRQALRAEETGHVLVFLPGMREIRMAETLVQPIATSSGGFVCVLHGDLSADEQDRAVKSSDRRKIVLATNVAESSITIDGVAAVVDSGLVRSAQTAPWSGLPALKVTKTSRASCTQRAGRAGRTRNGRAYRLFTRADFDSRAAHDVAEIRRLDLAQTLLELRAAGVRDLEWLDPPNPASLAAAETLLVQLGAFDAEGNPTPLGKKMLSYPVHPRIARILELANDLWIPRRAATAAAILGERDIVSRGDKGAATEASDVDRRVELIEEVAASRNTHGAARAAGLDPGAVMAVLRARDQLARKASADEGDPDDLRKCILAGFIDRVARRVRPRDRALALAGGGSAELAQESVVRDAQLMVAVDAEERAGGVLVRMASAIEPEWILDFAADRVTDTTKHEWDASAERVTVISRMTYEGLVLFESKAPAKPGPEAARVLLDAARTKGLVTFAEDLDDLLVRGRFAAEHAKDLASPPETVLEEALAEACEGSTSFADLRAASLPDLVRAKMGAVASRIERLAPARITLAKGRSVKINYEPGKTPWIGSRMQDFFGMNDTPRIAEGRVPLVLHLLAPNQRAVQVTQDLAGFWTRHYPTIRKELMRKYPRHAWPENPLG